ncbi:MAG: aminoacetone oxidase family FAD-binding enzyme, partial [Clostridiales bacterium]|nr:aminoacetone oxidase family FAD-binding enzyme [Clostridiales bacterium]
ASAVLDVFRYEIAARGIEVICGENAENIRLVKGRDGYEVLCGKNKYYFDKLIVTCGGQASPKTGSDGAGYRLLKELGLSIVRPVPALVQLRCKGNYFKALAGIRCEAVLDLYLDEKKVSREQGELQMTDYGISGIPVFQFSRRAAYALAAGQKTEVIIDLLPNLKPTEVKRWLKQRLSLLHGRTAEEFLTGTLHKKWILFFLKEQGIKGSDGCESIPAEKWNAVINAMKNFRVAVTDTNSFQNAQVCAGGVSLREVDENLESLKYRGLFIAGELLDVDGRCGGYNLQWAWCSGYLAAREAAKQTLYE